MKFNTLGLLSAATLLLSSATVAAAVESTSLGEALTKGKAGVNVRARYEGVDQDNIADKANAVTTRLRLNYETAQWNGLTGFAELDLSAGSKISSNYSVLFKGAFFRAIRQAFRTSTSSGSCSRLTTRAQ